MNAPPFTPNQPASSTRDEFGLVGRIVDGRYLVEAPVGHGGFGVVYRAQYLRLEAPVALKVLRIPQRLSPAAHERFVERFLQEGKLLFKLGSLHPAVARVLEAGTLATDTGLTAFLAMDWLEGHSLGVETKALREQGLRLSLPNVLRLLYPLVEGLAAAHERGIIHCDLKPGNVFLCRERERLWPKVLDFGLAHVVESDTSHGSLPPEAARVGLTPAYAAPEQWRPSLGALGPWTDVHALALIAVELLAARPALTGTNAAALKRACLDERRPTPARFDVALNTEAQAAFECALALEPSRRLSDVRRFWRLLARSVDLREARSLSLQNSPFGEKSAPTSGTKLAQGETSPLTLSFTATREQSGPEPVPVDAGLGARRPNRLSWGRSSALVVAIAGLLAIIPKLPNMVKPGPLSRAAPSVPATKLRDPSEFAEAPRVSVRPVEVPAAPAVTVPVPAQPAASGAPHLELAKKARASARRAAPVRQPEIAEPGKDDAIDPFSTQTL